MGRLNRRFSTRERFATLLGVGVSAAIAWWAYAPVGERLNRELGAGQEPAMQQPREEQLSLTKPAIVAAVNAARLPVKQCYLREFANAPTRVSVAIVEFWAEIDSGGGRLLGGRVPSGDSISEEFDECISQKLFNVHFETQLPPGRQKITFPYAFDLTTIGGKDAAELE